MAPALHLENADAIERVPDRLAVVHGRKDDVVPLEASEAFCERF
jgi:dipeptidyl aminopeptidase/acylaminoacyl peptidase